ncbi:hypothetical protein D9757_011311 [Collybiopsis confluens]|uniref:Uncharacterized protein n=1 Tax=Collybiopsis confluens TaxID=2823264 RepID=A0A8H5GNR1_9AGAR|nr:hypothetical protein D9757_011311 [Collybiopsis confluens]
MPRQSASSKGKGKEVEDPTQLTEADTAQSAGQASRKLSHLYRLAFRYPQAVTIQQVVVDEEVKDVEPTLLARWRHMRALPLWEQQCPPEFADEWGTRWNALHSALKNMSTLSTVTAVNKFKWKGNGLEDVALLAKTGKWDSCLNDDIESALEDDGKSIRAMYCTPYVCAQVVQTGPDGKQVTKGFVSPMHWDGYLSYLVPRILGCAFEYIDPDLIDWWHAMLAAILDARAKQRTRLDKRRDKHLKAVMAKLGAELWQFRLPNHLTVKKAQSALLSLKEVKVCLEWLTTSAEDAKIRAEPIDVEADDAAAKIQSRWARLSENAQKQDWVQMMLGFVMGLLGRRMDKEFPIDFGEEGQVYEYGICLAKAIPAQDLNQRFVQPDAEEVRAFHLKVVDFADSWLGRALAPITVGCPSISSPPLESFADSSIWIQIT